MKKHWGVLLLGDSLTRSGAVYHEYGRAGITACGREFSLTAGRWTHKYACWVLRGNAVRFARPCKRCAAAITKNPDA